MYYFFRISSAFLIATLLAILFAGDASAANNANNKSKAKKQARQIESPFARISAMQSFATPALTQWWRYRDGAPGATFEEISRFIEKHHDWPDRNLIQRRAEEVITPNTPTKILENFFAKYPPVSPAGKYVYGKLLYRNNSDSARAADIIRASWIDGNWRGNERDAFLEMWDGRLLRQKDHHARIDRLLWDNQFEEAKSMLSLAEPDYRRLYNLRMRMMRNFNGNPDSLLSELPESLRGDYGLAYARAQIYERMRRDPVLANILPGQENEALPHADSWWEIKRPLIRRLIERQEIDLAYRVASRHGAEEESSEFAEGEWLAGWIALRLQNNPQAAYKHFYRLFHGVNYPISLSRAAYWAACAARANNNADIARNWLREAANYPAHFYGQIALETLNISLSDSFPQNKDLELSEAKNKLQKNALLESARLLMRAQQPALARKFIRSAISAASTSEEMQAIAHYGKKIGYPILAVEAAKEALKKNVWLVPAGYPIIAGLPGGPLKSSFTLGVIRQESMFDPNATSPVGAKGLMQLMPATATSIARKNSISAPLQRLQTDPSLNMRVGSLYLNSLLNLFDGIHPLAIAAYNGGQGNVRKWRASIGPYPSDSLEQALDWIEQIPFSETRSYVQRVLEQYMIYSAIEGKDISLINLLVPHKKTEEQL
jgi:soluble lytic murein transglycosylase